MQALPHAGGLPVLSRRHAVTPEQPISVGTIRHGTPVSNTNTIAVNATRSSTRGRPMCSTNPRRTTPGSARGCSHRSATRCSGNDLLLEGLLERRLDITHRQPAQERADHQRLQRMRHALAQHQALEPQRLRVADPRTLQLDHAAGRLDRPRLIAVAMRHGLFAALIPCPAQEPAVLSACCKINQAPSRPTVSIGSTCSSTASNASSSSRRSRLLGATLAMRANLHQLRLVRSKRLRPPAKASGNRDATKGRRRAPPGLRRREPGDASSVGRFLLRCPTADPGLAT